MMFASDKMSTIVNTADGIQERLKTYLVELLMTPWTNSSDARKAIVMVIYNQNRGVCIDSHRSRLKMEAEAKPPAWHYNVTSVFGEVKKEAEEVKKHGDTEWQAPPSWMKKNF